MGSKKCPYCAEEVQDEAILCKHCHEYLDGRRQGHDEGGKTLDDGRFDRYISFLQQRYPAYQVVSKNYQENFIILNKQNDRAFSCVIFLLLLLLFILPALIYALLTMNAEKIFSVTIAFDSHGNPVSVSRKDFQWLIDRYNDAQKGN